MRIFENVKLIMLERDPNGYKIAISKQDLDEKKSTFLHMPVINISTIDQIEDGEQWEWSKSDILVIGKIELITFIDENYVYGNVRVFDSDIKSIEFRTHEIQVENGSVVGREIYDFNLISVWVDVKRHVKEELI